MNKKQDQVYVTYLYPVQFVVHEDEEIDFSIDEINNLSYDHSLLHRIIGNISNCFNNMNIHAILAGKAIWSQETIFLSVNLMGSRWGL